MAALVAALNYAYKRRMMASDLAWATVSKFKGVQARESRRFVAIKERKALLEAAATVGGGAIRDLLEGLMLTGARPIELARANVADYDATKGTLSLYSFKGQSSEPRVRIVPLRALGAEELIVHLTSDKLPAAPLFTRDDGQRWGHSDWDGLVREARARAHLERTTAYDLRHSFISEALAGGVDVLTVARLVGTSLEMISMTYGKLIEDHAVNAFRDVKLL
jgi:integrase